MGRELAWGFEGEQLRVVPHGMQDKNALYSQADKSLSFGWYQAEDNAIGRLMPKGYVFACLSHDIIAHELTHALLDGLRAEFSRSVSPDTAAFHEGFADIVALFQRFSYEGVVNNAIRATGGTLTGESFLLHLAKEFGQGLGEEGGIRGVDVGKDPKPYRPECEIHQLGSVLVSAVRRLLDRVRAPRGPLFPAGKQRHRHLAAGPAAHGPDRYPRASAQPAGEPVPVHLHPRDRLLPAGEHHVRRVPARVGHRRFRPRSRRPLGLSRSPDRGIWAPAHLSAGRQVAERGGPALARPQDAAEGEKARLRDPEILRRSGKSLAGRRVAPAGRPPWAISSPGRKTANRSANLDLQPRATRSCAATRWMCQPSSRCDRRRVGPDGQLVFDLVAEVTQRRHAASPASPCSSSTADRPSSSIRSARFVTLFARASSTTTSSRCSAPIGRKNNFETYSLQHLLLGAHAQTRACRRISGPLTIASRISFRRSGGPTPRRRVTGHASLNSRSHVSMADQHRARRRRRLHTSLQLFAARRMILLHK